jgi:hypothetical protein
VSPDAFALLCYGFVALKHSCDAWTVDSPDIVSANGGYIAWFRMSVTPNEVNQALMVCTDFLGLRLSTHVTFLPLLT